MATVSTFGTLGWVAQQSTSVRLRLHQSNTQSGSRQLAIILIVLALPLAGCVGKSHGSQPAQTPAGDNRQTAVATAAPANLAPTPTAIANREGSFAGSPSARSNGDVGSL